MTRLGISATPSTQSTRPTSQRIVLTSIQGFPSRASCAGKYSGTDARPARGLPEVGEVTRY
jgi:hypothetical protein